MSAEPGAAPPPVVAPPASGTALTEVTGEPWVSLSLHAVNNIADVATSTAAPTVVNFERVNFVRMAASPVAKTVCSAPTLRAFDSL
ncbi:hypothetical protein GCM10027167_57610 [Nocardia heshunensis]